jgi:hypothetical protein
MADPSMQSHFRATARVDGFGDLGAFATFSGGGLEGDSSKHRDEGGSPSIALAGDPDVADVELSRSYDRARDDGVIQRLMDLYGNRMRVRLQPLDKRGNPGFYTGWTYSGILGSVSVPETDANGGGDKATWTIRLNADGIVGR